MRRVLRASPLVALSIAVAATASALPAITLSPGYNHPSSTTRVAGSGFGPSKAIDIYWDTTDELLAVTDGSGAFSAKVIPVPAGALPGQHWVTAVERDNGDAAQKAFAVHTDWMERGFSERGHRENPYENVISPANASRLDIAWSFQTGGAINSSPAVVGGVVYIGSSDGNLYALDAINGAKKWSRAVGGINFSSPAVANGIVYVGSMNNKVYALNAPGGGIKWTYTTGGPILSSPTVFNGVVYIGSNDGNVYGLDATTGALTWSRTTTANNGIYATPAIAGGALYIGGLDGWVRSYDLADNNAWGVGLGIAYASPAFAGRYIFIGTSDGTFWGEKDDAQGTEKRYVTGNTIFASPAVANGTIYAASEDGSLYALGPPSHESIYLPLLWSYAAGDQINSSPAVANGVVYFGCDGGWVTAVDAATGVRLWEQPTDFPVTSSPAVSDGMVYVGSYDYQVHAYALNGGKSAIYHRDMRPPAFSALHPDYRLKPMR